MALFWLVPVLSLAAVIVRQDGAALRRGGCDVDAEVITQLPAATAVEVRFSVSGAANEACYRVVAVDPSGKTWNGYLPGGALSGLAEFDNARQKGGALDATNVQIIESAESIRRSLTGLGGGGAGGGGNTALAQASRLLDANRPGAALGLLEPLVRERTQNPDVYVLAGIAAWRGDQPKEALEYWKTALSLRPDHSLEQLYSKVEREVKGDQSGERLIGMRVALRYESGTVPLAVARQMTDILDVEVARISFEIGCPTEERLVAIVQSREAYFRTTQAAEWSGGQYNGRIRIPYDPEQSKAAMQRTFAHEAVHACLANLGTWPAWLHEGLAQKLSGDKLSPAMRDKLAQLAARHALPKLDDFRRDWNALTSENAQVAYATALAAAELLSEHWSAAGLRNILRNPGLFATVTADLNQRLGLR